jgi:hypothetical protein
MNNGKMDVLEIDLRTFNNLYETLAFSDNYHDFKNSGRWQWNGKCNYNTIDCGHPYYNDYKTAKLKDNKHYLISEDYNYSELILTHSRDSKFIISETQILKKIFGNGTIKSLKTFIEYLTTNLNKDGTLKLILPNNEIIEYKLLYDIDYNDKKYKNKNIVVDMGNIPSVLKQGKKYKNYLPTRFDNCNAYKDKIRLVDPFKTYTLKSNSKHLFPETTYKIVDDKLVYVTFTYNNKTVFCPSTLSKVPVRFAKLEDSIISSNYKPKTLTTFFQIDGINNIYTDDNIKTLIRIHFNCKRLGDAGQYIHLTEQFTDTKKDNNPARTNSPIFASYDILCVLNSILYGVPLLLCYYNDSTNFYLEKILHQLPEGSTFNTDNKTHSGGGYIKKRKTKQKTQQIHINQIRTNRKITYNKLTKKNIKHKNNSRIKSIHKGGGNEYIDKQYYIYDVIYNKTKLANYLILYDLAILCNIVNISEYSLPIIPHFNDNSDNIELFDLYLEPLQNLKDIPDANLHYLYNFLVDPYEYILSIIDYNDDNTIIDEYIIEKIKGTAINFFEIIIGKTLIQHNELNEDILSNIISLIETNEKMNEQMKLEIINKLNNPQSNVGATNIGIEETPISTLQSPFRKRGRGIGEGILFNPKSIENYQLFLREQKKLFF